MRPQGRDSKLLGQGRGKLSPWETLQLESGLGRVEGISTSNGGCTKGTCRAGCFDLPGEAREGRRIPFFLSDVNFLGKQRGFLQMSLCFTHATIHYIGKKRLVQGAEDLNTMSLDYGF